MYISPQVLCSEAADRGDRPHRVSCTRQKTTESLSQVGGFISVPPSGAAPVRGQALKTAENPVQRPKSESAFAVLLSFCLPTVVALRCSSKNSCRETFLLLLQSEVRGCCLGCVTLPASWEPDIQERYWFSFSGVMADGTGLVPWSEHSPRTWTTSLLFSPIPNSSVFPCYKERQQHVSASWGCWGDHYAKNREALCYYQREGQKHGVAIKTQKEL